MAIYFIPEGPILSAWQLFSIPKYPLSAGYIYGRIYHRSTTFTFFSVASESGVLYNVLISASYPDVLDNQCNALSTIGGITEEIRVRIQEINHDATYIAPDGTSQNSPLCMDPDCSDVIMNVKCPGTHVTIELHYTPYVQ